MPLSNWLKHPKARPIGALFVAVLFCAGWIGYGLSESAHYQRQADANNEKYASYTREKVAKICVGVSRLEAVKCLHDARDAQREYRYSQLDLVAQRQSALWAYIMAAAAVIGMGLSVIGVWLVWTTFRATKEANVIASESERPWLELVVGDEIEAKGGDGRSSPSVSLSITLKNHGGVPAVRVSPCVILAVVTQGFHYGQEYARLAEHARNYADDLGITVHPGGDPIAIARNMVFGLIPLGDAKFDPNAPKTESSPYIGVAIIYHRPGSNRRYYVLRFFRTELPVWREGNIKIADIGGEHHGHFDRD